MKFTAFLVFLSVLFTPRAALADYPKSICGQLGGYPGCAADYGKGGNDLIIVTGPQGAERIRVQCTGNEYNWQSLGPNTEAFVDGVARSWCGN